MKQIVPAKELMKLLCPALGVEYNRLQRLVLDMQYDSVVVAYIQLIGDARLLEVSQTLEGVKIESKVVSVQDMQP